jgi:putative endonuclease
MRKSTFGLLAEYIAIIIYSLKFYTILHHRRRRFVGEIDIIAVRAKQIVFIEVKARSSLIDDKLLSINQQNRIKRSALLYLALNPRFQEYQVRFDLVVIRPYKLPIIYKNAW